MTDKLFGWAVELAGKLTSERAIVTFLVLCAIAAHAVYNPTGIVIGDVGVGIALHLVCATVMAVAFVWAKTVRPTGAPAPTANGSHSPPRDA